LFMGLFKLVVSGKDSALIEFAFICSVVMLAWYTMAREAGMWSELDAQYGAVKRLLDNASHGFCTINPVNAMIQTASPQLHITLCNEELVNRSLADFMVSCDRKKLDDICSYATKSECNPFHVTCKVPHELSGVSFFDAKVIPFASSPDSVSLCMQMLSEMRHAHDSLVDKVADPQSSSRPNEEALTDSIFDYSSSSFRDSGATRELVPHAVYADKQPVVFMEAAVQTDAIEMKTLVPARPPLIPWSDNDSARGSSSSSSSVGQRRHRHHSKSRRRRAPPVDEAEPRPLLNAYQLTTIQTCMQSAESLMKFWNVPRYGSFCCPLHSSFEAARKLFQSKQCEPCNAMWSPNVDWQCPECTAMNSDADAECGICRFKSGVEEAAANTVMEAGLEDESLESLTRE